MDKIESCFKVVDSCNDCHVICTQQIFDVVTIILSYEMLSAEARAQILLLLQCI